MGTQILKGYIPLKAKTSEPRFERVIDVRCEDCEYNGYLNNLGFLQKGSPSCGHCSNGRIGLLLWEDILAGVAKGKKPEDRAKKMQSYLDRLERGRIRIVRPSDLLDPYLVRKKGIP